MIIFDARLGRYSILIIRETFKRTFRVTREGPGEVSLDLPWASVTFTNHRKAEASVSQ